MNKQVNQNIEIENAIKILRKKWLVISIILLVLGTIGVLLREFIPTEKITIPAPYPDYFAYFSILIFLPAGYFYYGKKCKDKAQKTEGLAQKLALYKKGLMIKYVLFSIATFLLAITIVISKHESALYLFAISIIMIFLNKPSKTVFIEDCKFKKKTEVSIENLENEVAEKKRNLTYSRFGDNKFYL